MDFAQFQAGLSALLLIPAGQKERSLTVGKVLAEADRLEFLRHLQEMDRQLREVEEERGQFLANAEQVMVRVEHAVVRLEREGEEQTEHEYEMQTVEAQLSPPPHGA